MAQRAGGVQAAAVEGVAPAQQLQRQVPAGRLLPVQQGEVETRPLRAQGRPTLIGSMQLSSQQEHHEACGRPHQAHITSSMHNPADRAWAHTCANFHLGLG